MRVTSRFENVIRRITSKGIRRDSRRISRGMLGVIVKTG